MKHRPLKVLALLVTVIALGTGWAATPVRAQDQTADLTQIIRQKDGALKAMTVEKLMSFNLSPAWWQYFLNRDDTKASHMISNLADSLLEFGKNMGGDDVVSLDQSGDASSPLVADALSRLQNKVHCTFELIDNVKDDSRGQVIENISVLGEPITEKYYCKPRGGKLHIFITLDPKAQSLKCQVSKDGNDYHFSIPAYMDVTTSPVEEAFKQGT